jgi:hypothetical protein
MKHKIVVQTSVPIVGILGIGFSFGVSLVDVGVGIVLFQIPCFLIGYWYSLRQDEKLPADSCLGVRVGTRQG